MFETAELAEAAFYEAFERADLAAMMRVWAEDEEVVCIHPMGPRIEGRSAVRSSWAQILADGGDGLSFEISHVRRTESDGLAVHLVYENITFGPTAMQRSLVLATNVYRRTGSGWRMICHHGSPGRFGSMQIKAPGGAMH